MNYTHAIITYSKTQYLIDDEKNNELKGKKLDDAIVIDGNVLKVRNISEVLTISKYYESYPDKRPQYTDKYKYIEGMGMTKIINVSREKALRGIKIGLEKYINSNKYKGTNAPVELLKMCEDRLLTVNN